jgi:hypothetical protein
MNRTYTALLVAALALPLVASAADKMKTDPTGCDNVNWSKEVLDNFPNAKRGCQRVTLKGEDVYAQYNGEVVGVEKDGIVVHVKDHDGKNMTKMKIAPDAEAMVSVSGKATKFWKLEKGTELHFYIPHNRWGLYSSPGGAQIKVVSAEQM